MLSPIRIFLGCGRPAIAQRETVAIVRAEAEVWMVAKTDWPKEPLTGEAVTLLNDVLQEWRAEMGFQPDSEAVSSQARVLVGWFEFGIRDKDELSRLLRDELTVRR
jgi:hypothetical protein